MEKNTYSETKLRLEITKMIESTRKDQASWTPPDTYKNKKPTPQMFGLDNIDLQKLQNEYDSHTWNDKNKQKKLSNFLAFPLIFFWIAPAMPIFFILAVIVDYFQNGTITFLDETDLGGKLFAIFYSVLGIAFNIYYFSKVSSNEKLEKRRHPFGRQDEYNMLQKYKEALKEYEWWKKHLAYSYWTGLSGRQFEMEIARLFEKNGFKVKICTQGGDGGIDLVLTSENKVAAVQCKAHASKISPFVARDLLGTMHANKIRYGYLVTLHGGTAGTIEFCKNNGIELWTLDDIMRLQNSQ